ncbi:MAG: hypothetical protein HYX52_06085 [Chloroflexi bacterium]|nr:hypothetical protein [Chloroflexota bacterium]
MPRFIAAAFERRSRQICIALGLMALGLAGCTTTTAPAPTAPPPAAADLAEAIVDAVQGDESGE